MAGCDYYFLLSHLLLVTMLLFDRSYRIKQDNEISSKRVALVFSLHPFVLCCGNSKEQSNRKSFGKNRLEKKPVKYLIRVAINYNSRTQKSPK